MPGLAGIVFILVFGIIVLVWSVWLFGREEQEKEARKKAQEQRKPAPDT
jgi:hypothetical protein